MSGMNLGQQTEGLNKAARLSCRDKEKEKKPQEKQAKPYKIQAEFTV